jgi:hypothetical protein
MRIFLASFPGHDVMHDKPRLSRPTVQTPMLVPFKGN